MNIQTKLSLMAAVAACCLTATAGVGYYKGTGNANKDWTDSSLWDGTVPGTADDLAVFPSCTNSVYEPLKKYEYCDLKFSNNRSVGSVDSAPIGTRMYVNSQNVFVSLRSTTNCWAQWVTANYQSGYKTLPNGGEPLELKNVYGGAGPTFDAQEAGDVLRVVNLYGQAAFTKQGSGEMELVNPAGFLSVGYLSDGTLTLGTPTIDDDCTYAANPYSHWDASQIPAEDIGEPDASGRRKLAKWAAASDGNDRHATVTHEAPFLGSRAVNIPGRDTPVPLVDFGAAAGFDTSVLGTPRALLTSGHGGSTSDASKNLREVFYVIEATTPASGKSFLTKDSNFHYATAAQPNDCFIKPAGTTQVGNVQTFGGAGLIDGVPYGGESSNARYYHNECELSVYSSYTLTNMLDVGMWQLCAGSGSTWQTATPGGGYRAAEILTYYRGLTDEERRQTIRYLQRKWMEGKAESYTRDVGTLFVRSSTAKVSVKDGKTARIRSVVATEPLVKTGAGTLELDRVYPKATASVTVNEGAVRFNATGKAAVKSVPTDGLWFHGDASAADSFVYVGNDESQGISQWKDCRGAGYGVAFTNALAEGYVNPIRVVGKHNGYCVDFGGTAVATDTYAHLVANASAGVVEAFIVWRNKTPNDINANSPGLWYDDCDGCRSNYGWLFYDAKSSQKAARFQACYATYDGVPIANNGFRGKAQGDNAVIAAAFQKPANILRLGVANHDLTKGGCQEIYEVLFYTRRLNDQERRNVEAYLLDKWHEGAVHPAETVSVGTLAFGEGASPVIDVTEGSTVEIANVAGAGTLVKRGAGTARVATLGAGVSGVELDSGTLAVAGDYAAPNAMTIHVDRDGNVSGGLSVDGTLTLPDNGTLTVVFDDGAVPAVGAFQFATAGSVVRGSRWTVVREGGDFGRFNASLAASATSLSLRVAPGGFSIFVR